MKSGFALMLESNKPSLASKLQVILELVSPTPYEDENGETVQPQPVITVEQALKILNKLD